MIAQGTILVVDDYPPSRYAFRRILSKGRFDVREAGDLSSARQALGPEIDALLLDVNLPDGNGIDFCREARQTFPHLPVVLISASYRATTQETAWREAGASAFLEQPISETELLSTLSELLGRRESDADSAPD